MVRLGVAGLAARGRGVQKRSPRRLWAARARAGGGPHVRAGAGGVQVVGAAWARSGGRLGVTEPAKGIGVVRESKLAGRESRQGEVQAPVGLPGAHAAWASSAHAGERGCGGATWPCPSARCAAAAAAMADCVVKATLSARLGRCGGEPAVPHGTMASGSVFVCGGGGRAPAQMQVSSAGLSRGSASGHEHTGTKTTSALQGPGRTCAQPEPQPLSVMPSMASGPSATQRRLDGRLPNAAGPFAWPDSGEVAGSDPLARPLMKAADAEDGPAPGSAQCSSPPCSSSSSSERDKSPVSAAWGQQRGGRSESARQRPTARSTGTWRGTCCMAATSQCASLPRRQAHLHGAPVARLHVPPRGGRADGQHPGVAVEEGAGGGRVAAASQPAGSERLQARLGGQRGHSRHAGSVDDLRDRGERCRAVTNLHCKRTTGMACACMHAGKQRARAARLHEKGRSVACVREVGAARWERTCSACCVARRDTGRRREQRVPPSSVSSPSKPSSSISASRSSSCTGAQATREGGEKREPRSPTHAKEPGYDSAVLLPDEALGGCTC